MINHPQKGLTLVESVVTVAIVGGLVATAFLGYQLAIPKSQASEMSNMVSAQSLALFKNMQNGYCTKSGTTEQIQGKYGTLSVSGAVLKNKGETCPSGCKLNFTFNSTSHPSIKGKVLALDVLNNFKYTKGAGTTLDEKFITKTLIDGQPAVGENCTTSTTQAPTTTDGEISGSEIGEAAPVPPTTPTEPTTPPVTPPTTPPVTPPVTPPIEPTTPPAIPAGVKPIQSSTKISIYQYVWQDQVNSSGDYELDLLGFSTQKTNNVTQIMNTYTKDILQHDLKAKSSPNGVAVGGGAGIDANKVKLNSLEYSVLDLFVYDVWRLTAYAENVFIVSVGYSVRLQGNNLPSTFEVRVANSTDKAKWQIAKKYSQTGNIGHYIVSMQSSNTVQEKTLISNFLGSSFVGPNYNNVKLGNDFYFEIK